MSEKKVTLASILTEYFGCKKPVLKHCVPNDYDGCYKRFLTRNGEKAYGQLVCLIYDVARLVGDEVFESHDEVIEALDDIAEGFNYGLE